MHNAINNSFQSGFSCPKAPFQIIKILAVLLLSWRKSEVSKLYCVEINNSAHK